MDGIIKWIFFLFQAHDSQVSLDLEDPFDAALAEELLEEKYFL